MSMSTHIKGVRDLDGKFAIMMAAKLACEAASVGYPQDLQNYFGAETIEEGEDYLRRDMEMVDISIATTECNRDMVEGYEVDLSKIPKYVRAIRFENSY